MVYRITKKFTFDAAHRLNGLPPDHKCGRLHGHTYTTEFELCAAELAPPGFVADFAELAIVSEYIRDVMDHRCLNDVLETAGPDGTPLEPTSENLARHLADWFVAAAPGAVGSLLTAVRVSETPSTCAEYRRAS